MTQLIREKKLVSAGRFIINYILQILFDLMMMEFQWVLFLTMILTFFWQWYWRFFDNVIVKKKLLFFLTMVLTIISKFTIVKKNFVDNGIDNGINSADRFSHPISWDSSRCAQRLGCGLGTGQR